MVFRTHPKATSVCKRTETLLYISYLNIWAPFLEKMHWNEFRFHLNISIFPFFVIFGFVIFIFWT